MDSWDYAGYWDAHARTYGPQLAVTHMQPGEYLDYYLPIIKRLAPARVTSVADVGCGAGLMIPLVRWLYPGATYHGYDVSAVMLDHVGALVDPPDALFLVDGPPRLVQPYDFILCHSVLTHITEDDAGLLLDAVRAGLWPAGRASVSIHTGSPEGMRGNIERVDYAPAHFEAMLTAHGLAVVDYVDGLQRYYAVERA